MSTKLKFPKVTSNLNAWLRFNCLGDGFDTNPLLAKSTYAHGSKSVSLSGRIIDNKGLHAHATFSWEKKRA